MRLRLYIVHGSHPCVAIQKALALKGLDYRVTEWPPPLHSVIQPLIFGGRTVPGLTIRQDGSRQRIQGSRAIMETLDELVPSPALFPEDSERRAAVDAAERWGDEVFQPVGRELVWAGIVRNPAAMVSYSEHSRLRLPAAAVRMSAPAIARVAARVNRTDAQVARRDLAALPAQLDRIDGWIADGTIGDPAHPNAADLQLASTVRLLMTVADARPLIDGRPCAELALRLFEHADGALPAGTLA